jgi:sugar (pentulose or hexulose) kinase
MIASGVLEWLSRVAYPESEKKYELMVEEALQIPPGSEGVFFLPSFFPGSGPTGKYGVPGTIVGLTLSVTRAHLYRAALEGLSYQLRLALELLERSFNIRFSAIRVVGGGSRNELWNRIRASVTGRKIITSSFAETTALGAAVVAFKGIGLFRTFEEARENLDYGLKVVEPEKERATYEEGYERYLRLYQSLSEFFKRE